MLYDTYGFESPDPSPRWMTRLSAANVAAAIRYLLEVTAEKLCWINEEQSDPVLEVLDLAKALATILAENNSGEGNLPVPVRIAVLAARCLDEGAQEFEEQALIDPFSGDITQFGQHLLTLMRQTAGDLRNAAGGM